MARAPRALSEWVWGGSRSVNRSTNASPWSRQEGVGGSNSRQSTGQNAFWKRPHVAFSFCSDTTGGSGPRWCWPPWVGISPPDSEIRHVARHLMSTCSIACTWPQRERVFRPHFFPPPVFFFCFLFFCCILCCVS